MLTASGGNSYCFSYAAATCTAFATATTYNYTMPTSGSLTAFVTARNTSGCTASTSTTIAASAPTLTLASAASTTQQMVVKGPAPCSATTATSASITPIVYTTTCISAASAITCTGLPTGVTGTWTANSITISGAPTAVAATYTYTVQLPNGGPSATGTIAYNEPKILYNNITANNGTVSGTYTLQGIPPFVIVLRNNSTYTLSSGNTVTASTLGSIPQSMTDATGAGAVCPYTGSDWYNDASHITRQRPGGAQNWETYIKDTRDNQIYRTVLMPDCNWWTAENMNYNDGTGVCYPATSCTADYKLLYPYTSWTTICPSGWSVPVDAPFSALITAVGGSAVAGGRLAGGSSWEGTSNSHTDDYGFTAVVTPRCHSSSDCMWYGATGSITTEIPTTQIISQHPHSLELTQGANTGSIVTHNVAYTYHFGVRCMRTP